MNKERKEEKLQFMLDAVCDATIQEHRIDLDKRSVYLKLTNNFGDIECFDIFVEEISTTVRLIN